MLSLVLMPLGLDRWALMGMGFGVRLALWVAHTVADWPAATLEVPHMPEWGLLLVALGMAWLCFCRTPVRLAGVGVLVLGLVSPAVMSPADILVSSDARVIALRAELGPVAQLQPGADRFVQEAFAQYWGVRGLNGLSGCSDGACLLRATPQGPAALLLKSGSHDVGCEAVTLLISAEPLSQLCRGLPRIDRFTVWREGAQAVWLAPLRIVSDKAWRGQRPWVTLPGERHEAIDLPMAQAE
jgi:competence protein ComEC